MRDLTISSDELPPWFAVSLPAGGIGIMKSMLIPVTERTCKIGLRMTVGARARVILRRAGLAGAEIAVPAAWMGKASHLRPIESLRFE